MRKLFRYSKAISILVVSLLLILATALSACAADEAEQTETVVTEAVAVETDQQVEEEVPDLSTVDEMLEATPIVGGTAEAEGEVIKPADLAEGSTLRASQLLDYSVINPQGERLGEIEELVIDLTSGQIKYAVIAKEEALGLAEDLFGVPLGTLIFNSQEEIATLDADQTTVANAPAFTADRWSDLTTPGWDTQLRQYWEERIEVAPQGQPAALGTEAALPDASWLRASELLGYNVVSTQLEGIGEVDDLMIDLENGQVRYAVLGFGGFLDLGEKLFAIPVTAFEFDPVYSRLVLAVPEVTLESAPGFNPDDWPDTANPRWDVDSSEYWQRVGAQYPPEPAVSGLTGVVINEPAFRASDLINADVLSPEGEDVGQVSGLMIGYPSGRVSYAALFFDGVEGLGDELYAVPLSALLLDPEKKQVIFDVVDVSTMAQAPRFEPGDWPDLTTPDWNEAFRDYWLATSVIEEPAIRASELIGYPVMRPQEEIELGTVEDMVIGLNSLQVNYVVLAPELTAVEETERILLPFYLLRLDPEEEMAITDMSPVILDDAPRFASDNWPELADPQWDNPYLAYWGSGVTSTATALLGSPLVGADGLRLKSLLEYDIKSPNGEELGEIEEILLDLDGEQVLYAIMETEGFLEFGEKLYPVPLDQLELDPLTEAMILDITEAELETAPGFEAAEWPNVTDPQWRTYWGNRTDAASFDETIVRATELLNYDVENPQDEDLGDIEDIVVNKEDGTVKYALLSFEEGLFNNDEKFFPIPLSIMAMDHANGNIILDIDQETLEEAPGFDPADWPETANALWEEDMLDFWENP